MIKILKNILSSNGYTQINIDLPFQTHIIHLFSPNEENEREEYFVTIQLHNQSNEAVQILLEQDAQELFEFISQSGLVGLSFEKNCTMLICHNENSIDRQLILSIEEDQYNFKKNVITHSLHELEDLHSYLTTNNINEITNTVINEVINGENGKDFLEFKGSQNNSQGYYSLIMKIILKLPFITYSPKEKELTNLCLAIENLFSPRSLSIYNQLLTSEKDWSEDDNYKQIEKIWGTLE